jgi:hypothetical protein
VTRLETLAADELRELSKARTPDPQQPVARLEHLEAEARALFIAGRDLDEVRAVVSQFLDTWLAWIRSAEPWVMQLGDHGPHPSEYLRDAYIIMLNGLWAAIARADGPLLDECSTRFVSERPLPDTNVGATVMVQARQLCLLAGHDFDRAAREMEESWVDWVELEIAYPEDDKTWLAIRGLAENDRRAVEDYLRLASSQRTAALEHAASSPRMLRSTLPAFLALDVERAALVRIALDRGMQLEPAPSALVEPRAAELWGLPFATA